MNTEAVAVVLDWIEVDRQLHCEILVILGALLATESQADLTLPKISSYSLFFKLHSGLAPYV
jgi:hypothetical protein